MNLPTLAVKTVDIKLPVSGKKVKIRPFTVKEQKNLLLAVEQANSLKEKELESFLISEFKNIINHCLVDSSLNIDDLFISDFMYLMLQLRSISVGESIELTYTCPCETRVNFNIELDKLKVKNKKRNYEKTIKLTEDISMVLDFLTVDDILKISELNDDDILLNTICRSIKKISDTDTVYETNNFTHEEIISFVEQIPIDKTKEIEEYFNQTPYLVYETKISCPEEDIKLEVVNLSDFFY